MPYPLTVDELKLHIGNVSLDDAALQDLLDAARDAINERAGDTGAVTETHVVSGRLLLLNRRATDITTVIESTGSQNQVTLAANDYRLRPSGTMLERLYTGTNPRWRWWGEVTVTYPSTDDSADRIRVQVGLVKLDMSYTPGVSEERIGDWAERSSQHQGITYAQLRDEYLDSLTALLQ